LTVAPPGPAAPLSVTVPVALATPATLVGFKLRETRVVADMDSVA